MNIHIFGREFDVVALLSMPVFAAKEVVLLVALSAFLIYRIPVRCKWINAEFYWRTMAFVAEILVIVGLLGLVTYAGRAKLEENKRVRLENKNQSEAAVQGGLNSLFFIASCDRSGTIHIPNASTASVFQTCQLVKNYGSMYDEKLDWGAAKIVLGGVAKDQFAAPFLRQQALKLKSDIDDMVKAKEENINKQWEDEYYRSQVPWSFILKCAFLAAIGVSIKCARAFLEFKKSWPKNAWPIWLKF
jgi:hypothetical protein